MCIKIPVHVHRTHNESRYGLTCNDDGELAGYIVAPDGTEAYHEYGNVDAIRLPGDVIGIELQTAMNDAKRNWYGLQWEPARACA